MTYRILVVALVLWTAGCATTNTRTQTAHASIAANDSLLTKAVDNYFAAINRRDLLALTAYVAPDVEWYSIIDGERILEVSGREALAQMLSRYFAEQPQSRWITESMQIVASTVAIKERAEWSEQGQVQSRTSIAVYEMNDGRIRRISYYLDGKR